MEVVSVWLINHKASLSPESPMNMDGSEYMVGVGVVPATDVKSAISKFEGYLAENKMTVLELRKCEQWDPENFTDGTFESKQINASAGSALEECAIYYALGESSESLEFDEDEDDE